MGSNLRTSDGGADRLFQHDGFSSTILDSFSSPGAIQRGQSVDSTNTFSSDINVDFLFQHNGFSSTILDSFSSVGGNPNDVTIESAGNIIEGDAATVPDVSKHDGFSSTILDSFNSAGTPTGVSCDSTDTYVAENNTDTIVSGDVTNFIYKHSGFSSTITDSFSSPSSTPYGIEWEDFSTRTGGGSGPTYSGIMTLFTNYWGRVAA